MGNRNRRKQHVQHTKGSAKRSSQPQLPQKPCPPHKPRQRATEQQRANGNANGAANAHIRAGVQRSSQRTQETAKKIKPGMVVEAANDSLGDDDLSRPKVAHVKHDAQGRVAQVEVKKGVIFRKTIDVPPDRVAAVEPSTGPSHNGHIDNNSNDKGKVVVAASEQEIDHLSATDKAQSLSERPPDASDTDDFLSEIEERAPTAEGQRRNEGESLERRQQAHASKRAGMETDDTDAQPSHENQENQSSAPHFSVRMLGPGLLAGMSGNDATAVASYAVTGASVGFSQLWLMALSTPLYQAVIYACAKIGRVTQQGLTGILRAHFGKRLAIPIAVLLVIANVALIAGDLAAIGVGLELVTGIRWMWFVLPVAAILWYFTVYQNFDVIKKVFLAMSFVFVSYLITGFLSHVNWLDALTNTVIPHMSFTFAGVSSAVALLGATLSPYTMFWQAQGEKEQQRPGTLKQQTRFAALDIATGIIGGNVVAYFIILTTAATLYTHHQQISTAADAANALEPLVGPFAKYLFAIGIVGAGVVAIPVLMASASYALSGAFGWPASLWRKPWQSEGFYLIMTGALAVSVGLALAGINPIQFVFYANVLQGALVPILMTIILLIGVNRTIMKGAQIGWLTRVGLVVGIVVAFAAAALLFYGLFTGQGA